jgi:hypothetical protein
MRACLQLRIVWLLLLSALAPYAEALPSMLAAGETCGMSCCRKAKSCCCRKARPSAGWTAARTCPANCGQPARLPGVELYARPASFTEARPLASGDRAASRGSHRAIGLNARITRLQRPPPAC